MNAVMDSGTKTYAGAVRCNHGGGSYNWQLTNDMEKLSQATDDDIIWVDNIEALRLELETRHPSPHPLLTVVNVHSDSATVHEAPHYDGEDPDEVYWLARQFGKVTIRRYYGSTKDKFEKHPDLFRECRLTGDTYGPTIVYDPKEVAKRMKKKAERKAEAAITTHEVLQVVHATCRQMWSFIEVKSLGAAATLEMACKYFTSRLAIFNMLYGKKAHRRWPPFQEFAKQWKLRAATNNGDKFEQSDVLKKFAAWMDKEVKCRMPKAPATWDTLDLSFPE